MIPKEYIAFDFELVEYQLDDGTPLLLARDAGKRWPIHSFEIGVSNRVLYELESGYVLVEHDDGAFRACKKVTDIDAVRLIVFARGQIPPKLQQLYASDQWIKSHDPPRPLEHWRGKYFKDFNADKAANEVQIPDLVREIIRCAIQLVHFLEEDNHNHKWRCEITGELNSALYVKYKVHAEKWWGPRTQFPPGRIGILELQWPVGTAELQQTIKKLQDFLEPAMICSMPGCFRLENPDRPTMEEEAAAVDFIKQSIPQIGEMVLRLREELTKLEGGHLLDQAGEEDAIPSSDAFLVYWLRQFTGANQTVLAKMMGRAVGRHDNQGSVSRLLKEVDRWLAANNKAPLPDQDLVRRAITLSPEIIDLGARQDGLTPRQRDKADE